MDGQGIGGLQDLEELEEVAEEVKKVEEGLEERGIDPGNDNFEEVWKYIISVDQKTRSRNEEDSFHDTRDFFEIQVPEQELDVRIRRTSEGALKEIDGWDLTGLDLSSELVASQSFDIDYEVPHAEELCKFYDKVIGITVKYDARGEGGSLEEALLDFTPSLKIYANPSEDSSATVELEFELKDDEWILTRYNDQETGRMVTGDGPPGYKDRKWWVRQALDDFDVFSYDEDQLSLPDEDDYIPPVNA